MILKNKMIIVFLALSIQAINSQSNNPIQIKSPETNSFEKAGNVPINLYAGSIDLKIPIYTIQAKSLNIPIGLSYDSSGFVPHKKTDLAGVNWSLVVGGKVSRSINGLPDEYEGNPMSNVPGSLYGVDLHGFLKGVRIKPYSKEQVYDLNSGVGSGSFNTWEISSGKDGYEGEPDLYSFSILGLRGKFMVGNDGAVKVESNDPNLKVDLSGLKTYGGSGYCIPPDSEIILTDGNGNRYFFGGDFSKYEIAYYRNSPGLSKNGFSGFPIINSFNISKIIMSNNEIISFDYYKGTLASSFCQMMTTAVNLKENAKVLSLESYFQEGTRIDQFQNCPGGISGCFTSSQSGPSTNTSYTLLKRSLLEKITYNNINVVINYKDQGYPIKHIENSNLYFNEYVVDNIEIKDGLSTVNKYSFDYKDLGGVNKRPFLTGFQEIDPDKKYSFEYSKTDKLPTYYTTGIDHWGFWNGNDLNTQYAPFDTYNTATGDYTLNNTSRDPNYQYGSAGLLNKIIYPTKGYTVFEYESQLYSKRVERNSNSLFLPVLMDVQGLCGGARIQKQSDYSNQGILSNQKEYKYSTNISTSISSGILSNWPRYIYYFEFSAPGSIQKLFLKSSSNVQQNTLDGYNVGYSKVYEISKGNGCIEHSFYNYVDTPDVSAPYANNLRNWSGDTKTKITPENLYKNFKNLYGLDYSALRGLKSKENFIAEDGSTKKTVEYKYNDFIDYNPNSIIDNNNYVSINHLSGIWVQGYKKYFNSFELKSKIISENFNGKDLKTEYKYLYTSPNHLQLSSQTTSNSKEDILETKYFYAPDAEMSKEPFRSELISKNMIGIPLNTQTFNNDVKLSEQKIIYDKSAATSNLLLPKYVLENKGAAALIVATDKNISYDKYDDKGNLLQYTLEGGTPISIIWGYDKTLVVAKIENIAYASIPIGLINEITTASSNTGTEAKMSAAIKKLYQDQGLANTMITGYTYKPLIGVTSMTAPTGLITFYEYDSFGRLQFVKDAQGNLLSENQYHYKN
jgi:hypothetical protein